METLTMARTPQNPASESLGQEMDLSRRVREIDPALDLEAEVVRLKKERNAVILAHYYQEGEIQDLADHVGDSLALAQAAAKTEADVIVFCGVHFMAETAKILNPNKMVLLPDLDAGCSLADRCPADLYAEWLKQFPGHTVINYINSSAAVKALSDIIVTSSNAVDIVKQLPPDQPIVFGPDRHLGKWVEKQTGRAMVLWPGFCIVHEQFNARRLATMRAEYPSAKLIAHPECEEAVLAQADFIGSTLALLKYVQTHPDEKQFIVATEAGILHQMERSRPDAEFLCSPPNSGCNCAMCPYMRLNTLEKLYLCLRDGRPEITMDEETRVRALRPVQRMLDMSKGLTPVQQKGD
jgi:quinolinate synthase